MALIRRNEREDERGLSRARTWDPFEMMQDLMRWDPFLEVSHGLGNLSPAAFVPSFEVKERKDAYVFRADLPGVKEEDLEISLTGNRLTVSGHRQQEQREEGERYYAYERTYGMFSRSFTLPEGIDHEHVNADMKSGVLTLVVPKKPEVQPKRITLKPGAEGEKAKA
jgi:HSP20 family protein